MANACIAYTNLVDTAPSITASSSNLLLPVSNVTNPHIARKWRGTTAGSDWVLIDMGAVVSFDTIAVLGITGTVINLFVSEVSTDGGIGDITTGSYVVNEYNSQLHLTAPLTGRYFRFDVYNGATGLAEIGRIFIGSRVQFPYNFTKGWSRSWNDTSLRSKTRGGQTQVWPDSVFRTLDVSFDFITQNDRDGFVEYVDRVNALKTDVLFITNPGSANLSRDSVWGLMTALTPVVQPSVSTFTKQYTIEERL